ncbi:MAG TPA: DMT family transporter [Anaeromyxobacteraceae bacterium]|nr:DMT family transporter [Anaeromyxobacteraceae bacterium]
MTRRGWWLFAALGIIWGLPYLLIKIAVADVSPAALVFLRTALGALLLAPLAFGRGELRAILPHWRPIVAFTVAEMAVPWVLLSDAERHISSGLTGLLIAAVPLVGALLAAVTGHERIAGRRLAGLLLGFAGVVVLLGLDTTHDSALALVQMAVVILGYAAGALLVSRWLTGLPSLAVVTTSLALCAVVYVPFALPSLAAGLPPPRALAAVAALGVVCTALAFVVFFRLIAEVGPVRATVVTYVNPAVAVTLGVLVLGEPVTVGTVAGFALILAGSLLATRAHGP